MLVDMKSVAGAKRSRLFCLLKDSLRRGHLVDISQELVPFVDLHLKEWIRNAIMARVMNLNEDYIIDIDRYGCDVTVRIFNRSLVPFF